MIDVICSGNLPHGTLRLIEFLKIPFVPEAFIPLTVSCMTRRESSDAGRENVCAQKIL